MRTLDDIIDQEYENDDGEIISQLEREITERDRAIVMLFGALMEHYQDSESDSLTRATFEEYENFVASIEKGSPR